MKFNPFIFNISKIKFFVWFLILNILNIPAVIPQDNINWREKGENKNVSFYDVQKNFYEYWNDKVPQKGQGYKVFKRWENFMAPRVFPSGDMRLPSKTYENYTNWLRTFPKKQLMKSRSSNWTALGPLAIPNGYDAASGRIDFVRFDPTNSSTLYVGASDGGLWKSTNGGSTWTTNTDFLPIIGCSDIAIDPSNTQKMYLATGNWESDRKSIGVLKSTDGGANWNTTSISWTATDNFVIRRLVMHPTNPQIMLIGTDGGIFRTTDAWNTNSWVLDAETIYDIEFKPGDPNTIYACGKKYWKSTDAGITWTQITSGLPSSTDVSRMIIAVTAANPSYVYIIAGNTQHAYKGTYRSTDSGNNFSLRSSTPNILSAEKDGSNLNSGQAGHDLAIVISPTDPELVTIGGINAWQSTNGGITWSIVAYWLGNDPEYPGQGNGPPDYVHADLQDIQYVPGSNTTLIATADGGIYKSTNNGGNWSKLSSNLTIGQQTCIALSATSPTIIVCGEQDIGTVKLNGSTWSGIGGGDGEDALVHRNNNNAIIISNPNGAHDLSLDGGVTRNQITGLPGNAEWLSPVIQDPVTASTVYVGGRPALYRKTDLFTNNNGTWETLGTPPGTGNIKRFVVAPSNNTIIYAIKENSISKSTNGGSGWTDITGSLPVASATPSNIAISNVNPDKVWITFSGYSDGNKVFKTTNGGTSWTNISSGLPNIPINTIVFVNNSSTDEIYIGADISVYYRNNSSSWTLFNTNLPNTAITDLEIYYPESKLRASTYGRGSWETPIETITLPITWMVEPTCKVSKNQIKILWTVRLQTNNDKFIVERSSDGFNFDGIGIIKGDGNLSVSKDFEFIDLNPLVGRNFYRIKQIDFNGVFSYSEMTYGDYKTEEIKFWPNPVGNELNIFAEFNFNLELIDLQGKWLKKFDIYKGENKIDISDFPKGIYVAVYNNENRILIKL